VLSGFNELPLILEDVAVSIAVGTHLSEQRPLIR
jgi:hypothetical protein